MDCVCVSLCSHMVLDEADQMLERGFAESVEEVLDEVFHNSKYNTNTVDPV